MLPVWMAQPRMPSLTSVFISSFWSSIVSLLNSSSVLVQSSVPSGNNVLAAKVTAGVSIVIKIAKIIIFFIFVSFN